jgi:hypothetical protein
MALPDRIEGINADFVGNALASRHDGVEVATVDIVGTQQGTSSSVQLLLTYNRNDAGLPESMFLKGTFFDHDFASSNVSVTEARFYDELAHQLTPEINRPTGYFGVVDDQGRAIAIMEDLTGRGVDFCVATSPASVDQVAAGLEQLAAMHAQFWVSECLDAFPWLSEVSGIIGIMRYLVTPDHFADYIHRKRAADIPVELTDRDTIARALETMFAADAELPHTLLHADPHLGNTFVEHTGRPGFLDWQFTARGPFIWDATYYLTGALTPWDRRASERDLLTLYRDALVSRGAPVPSLDDVWLAHRRHMLHGFLSLLVPEESQPESFSQTMGERFAAAATDLDSLQALS